jgi:Fe-S cluster assembly protein SufD
MSEVVAKTIDFNEQLIEQLNKTATYLLPDTLRVKALAQFEELGIPNAKAEDYKYCSIESIFKKYFQKIGSSHVDLKVDDVKPYFISDAYNLVLVNGKLNKELSQKFEVKGLKLDALKKAKDELGLIVSGYLMKEKPQTIDGLVHLNTAFARDGIFIFLDKNVIVEKPLHLIYINSSEASTVVNHHHLIVLQGGAQMQILETHVSHKNPHAFLSNSYKEIYIQDNAHLQHSILQHGNEQHIEVNHLNAYLQKDAHYTINTYTSQSELIRNNTNVALCGENGLANLNGLFLTSKKQLIDHHTLVDHRVPHCDSNELYKGISSDKGTGVFNGKILVRRDAQKTNAYQSSKNILLSEDSTIYTKPQLEIYADDVKCSHGTSTGKVSDEALFYLRSRGIGELAARKLLLEAFAEDVLSQIKHEGFRNHIKTIFNQELHNV